MSINHGVMLRLAYSRQDSRKPDRLFGLFAGSVEAAGHAKEPAWRRHHRPARDLSPPFRYSCPHHRFVVVNAPLASLRSSAMEPLKDSSNVTRLPGAEDIRLREPPHNFEAEQALLGAILVNNAAYQRVAEFLRPEHFADPLHGKLYDSLGKLIERGQVVSAVTLKTYVEQDEDMKAAGGAAYLARLAAASVH